MIARIEGVLEALEGSSALVRLAGGVTYEVLLPTYAVARLGDSIGRNVTLHTLDFLESLNQGTSFTPRLAGFLTPNDRQFYLLFTTVKGIGPKRALRCMTLETAMIAAAIANRDAKLLRSLPEIGQRMAETIIATLAGKADAFATVTSSTSGQQTTASPASGLAREALDVLVQLGENRVQAVAWIDRVLRESDEKPATAQELITRVYRVKAGA